MAKVAAAMLKPRLVGIKKKADYSEYGGAALFGLQAPIIKAHGSSNANAILNAIRQTNEIVEKEVLLQIKEIIKDLNFAEME